MEHVSAETWDYAAHVSASNLPTSRRHQGCFGQCASHGLANFERTESSARRASAGDK